MQYINCLTDLQINEPSVISLGKFDGLHSGHRYLMEAMNKGREQGLKTVLFTFQTPPVKGEGDIALLSTDSEKLHIFEKAGVDYMIECPFSEELRTMSPLDFLAMLTEKVNVKMIVAGRDFCFGYERAGNYQTLIDHAEEFGFQAVIVEKKQYLDQDISSSRIRECIRKGAIEQANELLGYPYFISGVVEHGNAIGRTIGIPTANLIPPKEKMLPPKGVYAVTVRFPEEEEIYYGICNIGNKPTIDGINPLGAETFIFDFDRDVYDRDMVVYLHHFIRPERKFDSLDQLKAQMADDISEARTFF